MSEDATRVLHRRRRFGWLAVAIGIAAGFLAGVLLVAALGGAKPAIRETTVTVRAQAPAAQPSTTTGGTVVVKTLVPQLVGQRLDVALDRIQRAGFDVETKGGGLFGILVEHNWEVTAQDPGPGGYLEQGSTIHISVDRR